MLGFFTYLEISNFHSFGYKIEPLGSFLKSCTPRKLSFITEIVEASLDFYIIHTLHDSKLGKIYLKKTHTVKPLNKKKVGDNDTKYQDFATS